MHFPTVLTTLLLSASAFACGPLPRSASPDPANNKAPAPAYPKLLPGDDKESSPATAGYFINHLCINVGNMTESVNWYNKAFGLRTMFSMQVSEHFAVTYMGRSHGGRNGTGYQTAEELTREKNNIEGLIELLHVDAPSWNPRAGKDLPNTFHHIGMVVPDPEETQKHLDAMGAKILKRYNEPFKLKGGFAIAAGVRNIPLKELSQKERNFIEQTLAPTNEPLIFVADPDGNLIEVQAQVERIAFGQAP
jgi:lactoylglutathione lyase